MVYPSWSLFHSSSVDISRRFGPFGAFLSDDGGCMCNFEIMSIGPIYNFFCKYIWRPNDPARGLSGSPLIETSINIHVDLRCNQWAGT